MQTSKGNVTRSQGRGLELMKPFVRGVYFFLQGSLAYFLNFEFSKSIENGQTESSKVMSITFPCFDIWMVTVAVGAVRGV